MRLHQTGGADFWLDDLVEAYGGPKKAPPKAQASPLRFILQSSSSSDDEEEEAAVLQKWA